MSATTPAKANQIKRNNSGGRVANASAFKKNTNPIVRLPSGHNVRVKRLGMERFLTAGFLPDPLAKQVKKMISQREGRAENSDLLQNLSEKDLLAFLRAVDRIAVYCIQEPEVRWHERPVGPDSEGNTPTDSEGTPLYEEVPEEERSETVVYTDELDMEDKMFIFQFAVGGSSDVGQFRAESAAAVEALQSGGKVVNPTE